MRVAEELRNTRPDGLIRNGRNWTDAKWNLGHVSRQRLMIFCQVGVLNQSGCAAADWEGAAGYCTKVPVPGTA